MNGLLTRRDGEVVPCASYEAAAARPSRALRRAALIALLSAPSLSQGGLVQAQSSADSAAAAAAAAVPADGTVEILPIALRPPPKRPPRFFREETPLTATLTANFNELRGDKMTEDAPWRPAVLTVSGEDSALTSIPVRVRTRGKWRLGNCELPPMRLNFWKDSTRDTPMSGLDKPKLVNLCRDRDAHEEYLLQEYQLYRVYALLTAYSLPARLLRLSYADSGSGRIRTTRWAFLTEEPESLAERMDAVRTEQTGAKGGDLDAGQHVLSAVFQYMIGNTDWSVGGLHNAELYGVGGTYLAVPYDFDFSGAVNASYATVDPSLSIRRVRDRLYRGYCVGDEHFEQVFALFNEKREAIYALYRDEIGQLLTPRTVESTLRYFDDFYETINNPRSAKRQIADRCFG